MSYGENPNKLRECDDSELMPEYPVIWLNVGPYAIWWTGNLTGYMVGDDCIAWIAPILARSPLSPPVVDYLGARPIHAIECWDGTTWANRTDGPSFMELARIRDEVRAFTLLATNFRGELGETDM